MKLGIRLLLGFFLITGLAAFFVLQVFVAEVKPSVREVMEDVLVDTANILAEIARDDMKAGKLAEGQFAAHVKNYATRPISAKIWGLKKTSLDFRVYVTDEKGVVVFDSLGKAQGEDFSQWRDVARTLRGEYGARATRIIKNDDTSSVLYVAAPVIDEGKIVGVLTVAKPVKTIQPFIDRAERKILLSGALLLVLSLLIGLIVTAWLISSIRQLRRYAQQVQAGERLAAPKLSGELGELALAMQAMRKRLESREYIENYIRALTHELKSPIAAIQGSAELLQDALPAGDRARFGRQITDQTLRLQQLVEQVLELSKLEQRQALDELSDVNLFECADEVVNTARARAQQKGLTLLLNEPQATVVKGDKAMIKLALSNVLENAIDFSPVNSAINISISSVSYKAIVTVQDQGCGVPEFAFPRLGERFFSTAKPDSAAKGSGLGLAIVKQVMQLHGGTMQINNTHPGLQVELVFAAA